MVNHLPTGRHLAVDEQGVGLRATWRLERGFLNLSLWRDDRCVEAFHLTPAATGELIGFLARGLAAASDVATSPTSATIHALPDEQTRRLTTVVQRTRATSRATRARTARWLRAVAERLSP